MSIEHLRAIIIHSQSYKVIDLRKIIAIIYIITSLCMHLTHLFPKNITMKNAPSTVFIWPSIRLREKNSRDICKDEIIFL